MYAVVKTGGKQYKVAVGDEIFVEKLEGGAGQTVEFDEVLMAVNSDGEVLLGDELANVAVRAEIVRQGRGKKIIVFKFKAKKNYRRKQGHRQPYTRVRITGITGLDGDEE
ncbi:MAG: 50S ribosomal protein L21 [Clostridiaceae bacterium]|nr:50S ribosomal protein L21 [Clostridiaceae bacterium]